MNNHLNKIFIFWFLIIIYNFLSVVIAVEKKSEPALDIESKKLLESFQNEKAKMTPEEQKKIDELLKKLKKDQEANIKYLESLDKEK